MRKYKLISALAEETAKDVVRNEEMHCWVNKGAKGIALLDEDDAHGKRLKYVFDVSDVHAARRIGRYPELWELHEEHKEDVIKRL